MTVGDRAYFWSFLEAKDIEVEVLQVGMVDPAAGHPWAEVRRLDTGEIRHLPLWRLSPA